VRTNRQGSRLVGAQQADAAATSGGGSASRPAAYIHLGRFELDPFGGHTVPGGAMSCCPTSILLWHRLNGQDRHQTLPIGVAGGIVDVQAQLSASLG